MGRVHKEEMIKFANSPVGTIVWCKMPTDELWDVTTLPSWDKDLIYILDDEYASLRKQFVDDKTQIEWLNTLHGEWEITTLTDLDMFTQHLYAEYSYRIKPKTVTKWKWVIYDSETCNYFITSGFYTGEEGKEEGALFICKIEETAIEEEL